MATKRKAGRPSKPILTKATDEELVLLMSVGGTFVEAAALFGCTKQAIFIRMAKDQGLREAVYQGRALGLGVRKALLEDAISDAALLITQDPRYTQLAIFAAKALLKWSDIPDQLDGGNKFKEILMAIVENKRALAHSSKSPAQDYLPIEVTAQVKK